MELTKSEIKKGFWNWEIRKPEYLNSNDNRIYTVRNLGLDFIDDSNKPKELKRWNEIVENLDNVEYVWTHHKLSQETFESICRMKNLKGINIKWGSIKDLKCLENQPRLQHLHIGSAPAVENIEPISTLSHLVSFNCENLKRITNWEPLTKLKQLQGLGVNGAMYQRLKLDSIEFVSGLDQLKHLMLISTNILNRSLKPIESLITLEALYLTNDWPDADFQKLREQLPHLKYGNVATESQ